MIRDKVDIVIGGAGVAGIAAAEALSARLPDQRILLVDKLAPFTLTSANSGELYRNWWLDGRMAGWMQASIERMEAIAAECGTRFSMNRRGYAFVYTTHEGELEARSSVERWGSFGLGPVRVHEGPDASSYVLARPEGFANEPDGVDLLLDPSLIRSRFPYLTGAARAVIHARRGGWLDAHGFGMRLLELARARGVEVLRAEIADVSTDARGVRGVELTSDDGRRTVETRCFVDAAGPFLADIARMVGLELPVVTVLHQLVVMPDPHGVVPRDAPYTILMEPQELLWSDEERAWLAEEGLEHLTEPMPGALHLRPDGPSDSTWIRLGWPYHRAPAPARWTPDFPSEFPEVVVRGAGRLCPGMARYGETMPPRVSVFGGYYCKTRENLPLVGPTEVAGFYLLGALSGYGLMAACAAADALTGWVAAAPLPGSEYFSTARYDDPEFVSSPAGPAAAGEL